MAVSLTAIPSSFGSGGANIGDGVPRLQTILAEHVTASTSVDAAQNAALAAAAATAAGNTGAVKQTVTIALADLSGLAGGTKTFTKSLGAVLPTNARFLGVDQRLTAAFTASPALVTGTVSVGVTGTVNALVTANDVTSTSGFPKAGTAGAKGYAYGSLSGLQPTVTITTDKDLNTCNAGSISVDLFYVVLA